MVTSVTEVAIFKNQVNKAKEACNNDRKNFEKMTEWFKRTRELNDAFKQLLGINVGMEALFGDIARLCGILEFDAESAPLTSALRKFLINVMKLTKIPGCRFSTISPHLRAAILSVVFVLFIIERRNRFMLSCIISVQRLGLGLVASVEGGVELGRLVTSAFVKSAEVVPRAVAARVTVGLLSGIGIALDAANIVLNSIDLAKGSKSVEQDKILEVMKELKKEMEVLADVNKLLN